MVDAIHISFRGEDVFMPRTDITNLIEEEWFLSNILQEKCFADGDLLKTIHINEDKNTAMSLIDSMRYSKLIVIPGVSLDYMLALSEKWCLPEFVNESLMELIEKNKNSIIINDSKSENNTLINMFTFQCINCKFGCKITENTKNSCRSHPGHLYDNKWSCCGGDHNSRACGVGFHVMCNTDKEYLRKIVKSNDKE